MPTSPRSRPVGVLRDGDGCGAAPWAVAAGGGAGGAARRRRSRPRALRPHRVAPAAVEARWGPALRRRLRVALAEILAGERRFVAGRLGPSIAVDDPARPALVLRPVLARVGVLLRVDRPVGAARGAVPGPAGPVGLERLLLGGVVRGRAERRLLARATCALPGAVPSAPPGGANPPTSSRTSESDCRSRLRRPLRVRGGLLVRGTRRRRPRSVVGCRRRASPGCAPGPRPTAGRSGRAADRRAVCRPARRRLEHLCTQPGSRGTVAVPLRPLSPGGWPWPGVGRPAGSPPPRRPARGRACDTDRAAGP